MKVIVWGASSKLGHLLCERLHTKGNQVTAAYFKKIENSQHQFEGDFSQIHCLSVDSIDNHLDIHDFDISIYVGSNSEPAQEHCLESLQTILDEVWKATEKSYDNFYRQRDGRFIIVSGYSQSCLWPYRNTQGIESLWKDKFQEIDSSISHVCFHEDEMNDYENICLSIERSMSSSACITSKLTKTFSFLKLRFLNILRTTKKK